MPLISLTYVSVADHRMPKEELLDILTVSRKNNKPKNITGMLLYRDHFFIQALEGEEAVVMPLYHKIEKDPRHHNVLLVGKDEIEERSFGDWSMGFRDLDDLDVSEMDGYTDFLDQPFDLDNLTDVSSRAVAFLNLFRSGINY